MKKVDIFIPYIHWNGEKILLDDTSLLLTTYNVEETKSESFESNLAADIAVFTFPNVVSPMRLSHTLPHVGMKLSCDFHHHINPKMIEDNKGCYFWETTGVVNEYVPNVSNFFIVKMEPLHTNGGSSGCPLYADGIVYGILHGGKDNTCAFYSADHAAQLLSQVRV